MWVEPEVIWAARAFYAAKGFAKAKQQLIDGGFWLQEQSDNAQSEVREFDNYDEDESSEDTPNIGFDLDLGF